MTARSLTVPADIQRCGAVSDNRPSELRDALSVRTYVMTNHTFLNGAYTSVA
jgi:hypothetical protein